MGGERPENRPDKGEICPIGIPNTSSAQNLLRSTPSTPKSVIGASIKQSTTEREYAPDIYRLELSSLQRGKISSFVLWIDVPV